jgi:hypothetical protein
MNRVPAPPVFEANPVVLALGRTGIFKHGQPDAPAGEPGKHQAP